MEQRYTIDHMIQQGYKQFEIARCIGKDKLVVSRELKRNCDLHSGKCNSELAQRKCEQRHKEKPRNRRFTEAVQNRVETLIKEDYSPEQVHGCLTTQGIDLSIMKVYTNIFGKKKGMEGCYIPICVAGENATENVEPSRINEG